MKFWQVDAFSDSVFNGNPAAVFVVSQFPHPWYMQQIAMELNLSQSAFVRPLSESEYEIRWFSPKDEAPICGHATLASAHVLWKHHGVQSKPIVFYSVAGPLRATTQQDGWIALDFPAKPLVQTQMPELLNRALGAGDSIRIESVWRDDLVYVVVLSDVGDLVELRPNLNKIAQLDARAVSITAYNDKGFLSNDVDYFSRYFAPKVGIPEDPVCGSSHCRLAPFWANRLGKTMLTAYQASSRGGMIRLTVYPDRNRVMIAGQAISVSQGEFFVDQMPDLPSYINQDNFFLDHDPLWNVRP